MNKYLLISLQISRVPTRVARVWNYIACPVLSRPRCTSTFPSAAIRHRRRCGTGGAAPWSIELLFRRKEGNGSDGNGE